MGAAACSLPALSKSKISSPSSIADTGISLSLPDDFAMGAPPSALALSRVKTTITLRPTDTMCCVLGAMIVIPRTIGPSLP